MLFPLVYLLYILQTAFLIITFCQDSTCYPDCQTQLGNLRMKRSDRIEHKFNVESTPNIKSKVNRNMRSNLDPIMVATSK